MRILSEIIKLLYRRFHISPGFVRRGMLPVGVAIVMFVGSLLGLAFSFRVLEVSTITMRTGAASPSQGPKPSGGTKATNTPKPPSQGPKPTENIPLPTNTQPPSDSCPASCNCGCDSNHPGQCNPDTCHGDGNNPPGVPATATPTPTPTVCPGPDYSGLKFLIDYLDDPTVTSSLQPVIYPQNLPPGHSPDKPWQYAGVPPGNYKLEWTVPAGAVKYGLRIWDIGSINNPNPKAYNASLCSANPTANPAGINDVCTDNLTTPSFNYRFEAGHEYAIWLHAINSCGGGWFDNRGLNVEIYASTPNNPVACSTSCESIGQSGTASVCTYKDHPAFQQLVCSGFWASPDYLSQAASVPNFPFTCIQCPSTLPTATSTPTSAAPSPTPASGASIGIYKNYSAYIKADPNDAGAYEIEFFVDVFNNGTVPLKNVVVKDQLVMNATGLGPFHPSNYAVTVKSITGSGFFDSKVNLNYDGHNDPTLSYTTTADFPVGGTGSIYYKVSVKPLVPGITVCTHSNYADVSAQTADGTAATKEAGPVYFTIPADLCAGATPTPTVTPTVTPTPTITPTPMPIDCSLCTERKPFYCAYTSPTNTGSFCLDRDVSLDATAANQTSPFTCQRCFVGPTLGPDTIKMWDNTNNIEGAPFFSVPKSHPSCTSTIGIFNNDIIDSKEVASIDYDMSANSYIQLASNPSLCRSQCSSDCYIYTGQDDSAFTYKVTYRNGNNWTTTVNVDYVPVTPGPDGNLECSANPEECNAADDNCNGLNDEYTDCSSGDCVVDPTRSVCDPPPPTDCAAPSPIAIINGEVDPATYPGVSYRPLREILFDQNGSTIEKITVYIKRPAMSVGVKTSFDGSETVPWLPVDRFPEGDLPDVDSFSVSVLDKKTEPVSIYVREENLCGTTGEATSITVESLVPVETPTPMPTEVPAVQSVGLPLAAMAVGGALLAVAIAIGYFMFHI